MLKYTYSLLLFILSVSCSSSRPEIEVACEAVDNFEYLIKWDVYPIIQGSVKIYNSSDPENFDTKGEPIAESPISDQAARVKINQNLHRQYFLVRFDDKYDIVTATRAPKLNYIQNFRDIGGYRNNHQKYIRWGMIYRAGSLDSMDYLSTKRLNLMGIRTLIDFRNLENFRTPPGTLHLENVINLPLSLPCEAPLCDKIKNNELLRGDAVIFMQDLNLELSEKAKSTYKSMFNQLIVEDNYPIIISGDLGKDYVGFAIALIMVALDMPKDVILYDYLLSNTYLNKRNINLDCHKYPVHVQEAITTLLSADERYLSCGLEKIIRDYGSITKYLEKELGVTQEKRNKPRQILLQNK